MNDRQNAAFSRMPLIAILRGITPAESLGVADTLIHAGFRLIEVTLDSPQWQKSMEKIATHFYDRILLGAGTVLSPQDVDRVYEVGGQVVISPNTSVEVIIHTKARDMISVPGCFTPSESFLALEAGADVLKIFPADTLGIGYLKSLAAVLPDEARLCPTGGINEKNIESYLSVGVHTVGIGAALYQPGIKLKSLDESARKLVDAVNRFHAKIH